MGRSRGGLTTKIHALVDAEGRPVRLALTPGQAGDAPAAPGLLELLAPGATLIADRAYDTDAIRGLAAAHGARANIPVFDKSERRDGAFPATDFFYDHRADAYACPGGKMLKPYWRDITRRRPEFGPDGFKRYFARKQDCAACALKPRCTPNQPTRKLSRSGFEGARQMARDIAITDAYVASSYARKKIEMLFA